MFFCFRLVWPTGPVDRHLHKTCTLVHVCRPTAQVDRLSAGLLSGFLGRPPGSTAFRNLCFFLDDGRPERSTRAQRLLPGRPDRSTGRPTKCQRLFPFLCNSEICFLNLFLQTFSDVLVNFFRSNRLKIICF